MKLQKCGDMLYKYICADLEQRNEDISAKLEEKVRSVTHPIELCIPIWDYNGVVFKTRPSAHIIRSARRLGDDWSIDDESGMYTCSIDEVLRKTDVCARLAVFFSGQHFHVRIVSTHGFEPTEHYTPYRFALMLHYYPKMVPQWVQFQNRLGEDRMNESMPSGEPFIFKGMPYFPGLETPPPPPAPETPPRLVRPTSRIHYYEDTDDMRKMARDLAEEFANESVICYCHEED